MSLYINQGPGGPRTTSRIWTPGDPGQPNRADSKEELLSFCPKPEHVPCVADGCGNLCYIHPLRESRRSSVYWQWLKLKHCLRCRNLLDAHGLELAELVAMWEKQNRRCYKCDKLLTDPRATVPDGKQREVKIDHDHKICPPRKHSCQRCHRGLACQFCNSHALAVMSRGLWALPEKPEDVADWLRFLGAEDRDRLRRALALFPEQSNRQVPQQRSRGGPSPAEATLTPAGLRLDQAG